MDERLETKKLTVWTRNFTILFISNCIINFGHSIIMYLLNGYLITIGIASTAIGFIVSMFSFAALGFRPFSGPLIDGWNKKKLYMIMLVIIITSYVGYSFSHSLPLIILSRFLHGLGQGCISALSMAMAGDALPKEKLSSGMSLYVIGSVVAGAISPALGLSLMERFGYSYAFLLPLILLAIALVLSSFLEHSFVPGTKIRFTLSGMICKAAIVPAVLVLLSGIVRIGISTYLVEFITNVRHVEGMKVYYYVNAAAMILSRPFFGRLTDKKGLHISLIPSYVFFALSLVATAFCRSTWQLMLVAVLNALGYGTAFSSQQAMCVKVAPPELRGAASNTSFVGLDIGEMIGPIMFGALLNIVDYSTMFLILLIPLAISALLLLIWAPKHLDLLKP